MYECHLVGGAAPAILGRTGSVATVASRIPVPLLWYLLPLIVIPTVIVVLDVQHRAVLML